MDWKPIETAPLNVEVLVYSSWDEPSFVVAMRCDDGIDEYWRYADKTLAEITGQMDELPDAWSPLPKPPIK